MALQRLCTQRGREIRGFRLGETLGEGTFGRVKVAIDHANQQCAVKIVPCLPSNPASHQELKKEASVHILMKHDNVVKFFFIVEEPDYTFFFMELAVGGELFDRIEPDVGLARDVAHFYFRQLMSVVGYLHNKGVTHRDIKPENLLLDLFGNLKLTDFGLATLFRLKGSERELDRNCGTPPYVAPEVLAKKKYRGQHADLWSSGVVLVTMLVGALPWDMPSLKCAEYTAWCRKDFSLAPWSRITADFLPEFVVLQRLLKPQPAERWTMDHVRADPWFQHETALTREAGAAGILTRRVPGLYAENHDLYDDDVPHSHLRGYAPRLAEADDGVVPVAAATASASAADANVTNAAGATAQDDLGGPPAAKRRVLPHFHTQPVLAREVSLDVASPSLRGQSQMPSLGPDDASQGGSAAGSAAGAPAVTDPAHPRQPLVGRTTRLFTALPLPEALRRTADACDAVAAAAAPSGQTRLQAHNATVVVDTTDAHRQPLTFSVRVFDLGGDTRLVDFRRAKGDGLAFKRVFQRLRALLADIVRPDPALAAPVAGPASEPPRAKPAGGLSEAKATAAHPFPPPLRPGAPRARTP